MSWASRWPWSSCCSSSPIWLSKRPRADRTRAISSRPTSRWPSGDDRPLRGPRPVIGASGSESGSPLACPGRPREPVPPSPDDAGQSTRLGHQHGPCSARADQDLEKAALVGNADRRPHLMVSAGKNPLRTSALLPQATCAIAPAGFNDVIAAAMTMVATENTRHIFVLLRAGAPGCFRRLRAPAALPLYLGAATRTFTLGGLLRSHGLSRAEGGSRIVCRTAIAFRHFMSKDGQGVILFAAKRGLRSGRWRCGEAPLPVALWARGAAHHQ